MSNNAPFRVQKGITAAIFPTTVVPFINTTLNVSSGQYFRKQLTTNTTLEFFNAPASGEVASFIVEVDAEPNYDLANASYDSVYYNTSTQDTTQLGVFFKPDGTSFYVAGGTNDTIYQYDLSTAFDLSTTSYVASFSVSTLTTNPMAVVFKPDGTKMYVLRGGGLQTEDDYIYTFDLPTAWDISSIVSSTPSQTQILTLSSGYAATDMCFNNDGTRLFVINSNVIQDGGDWVRQIDLNTAWDVGAGMPSYLTPQDRDGFFIGNEAEGPYAIKFRPDGFKFFIGDSATDRVYQYSCTTPFDVTTAEYDGISFSTYLQEGAITSINFNSDGSKMYIGGTGGDDVLQYTTTTSPSSVTLTWPTNIKWDGGTAPAATGIGEKDLFLFFTFDGGTTYYGKQIGDNV